MRLGAAVEAAPARDSDAGRSGVLLVASALLLAAAAGGSAVLGVAARSATRHA